MTEAEHISRVIRPVYDKGAFRWSMRPWRGLAFFGTDSLMHCYAYSAGKILHKIDAVAWIDARPAAEVAAIHVLGWVQSCVVRPKKATPVFPVDDAPWELHAIEDIAAYLIALESYRNNI